MDETSVAIPCGSINLAGRLHAARKKGAPAAIIMHPHPMYGGDMDSSVVAACTAAIQERGGSTLRFNFRGTGGSGGMHSGGPLEVQDALSALAFLRNRTKNRGRLCLVGYSFGAYVGAMSLAQAGDIDRAVLIAPPTAWGRDYLPETDTDVMIIAGDRDHLCDVRAWEELARTGRRIIMHTYTGESHFFGEFMDDAADMTADYVAMK